MSDKIEEIRARHELVGGSGSVIHPTGFSWTIPGWVAHADRATLLAEVDRQRAEIERLREALTDMLNGWRYIRDTYGDLAGVGWDRAEQKAREALEGKP